MYISPKKTPTFWLPLMENPPQNGWWLGRPPWPMPPMAYAPAAPRHPGTVEHFRCAPRGTDEFSWNMNGHQHSWNMKLWKIWSTTRLIHENIRLYIYIYIYIYIYLFIFLYRYMYIYIYITQYIYIYILHITSYYISFYIHTLYPSIHVCSGPYSPAGTSTTKKRSCAFRPVVW